MKYIHSRLQQKCYFEKKISLLSKGLNFVPTSNTIDKAKLKNEENVFDLDQVKPKSTFNPSNKDVAIEVYMST